MNFYKSFCISQAFTELCKTKFPFIKWFGIEGLDSFIPALDQIINYSA